MTYKTPTYYDMTSEDRARAFKASEERNVRREDVYKYAEKNYDAEDSTPESKARMEKDIDESDKFRKDVYDIISKLSRMCNMGQENELIDEVMYNLDHEHRTLQQGIMRVLVGVLNAYADSSFDGRNADAVRFARKFRETFKNEMYLPLI